MNEQMTPGVLIMSISGLLALFILATIVLPRLQRRENRDHHIGRIIEQGYRAHGYILDVIPTERYHSGQPELSLRMRIESRTRLPIETTAIVTVYSMYRSRFQEGMRVPVRVLETRNGIEVAVKGSVDYP